MLERRGLHQSEAFAREVIVKMEIVVNTAKRKKPKKENEGEAKKPFVPRSALDVQKLQFEKLMKDPVIFLFP